MDRSEIVMILNNIGMLLELKGENFFKSKAYYDAARRIEVMEENLEELVRDDKLKDIKGFGKALTQKITELVKTGRLDYYNRLKASFPEGLFELLKIQGLGPKRISTLYNKLGICNIEQLKQACNEGKLLELAGFGRKTQAAVIKSIDDLDKYSNRYLYYQASEISDLIIKLLDENEYVIRCSIAGSLRRKKEIIKDIDIIASSEKPDDVMGFFTSLPMVTNIINRGETKTSVIMDEKIQVDLRVVGDKEYPYALHHFTGSKEHNTAMRHMAKDKGLKMNEYGIFDLDSGESADCRNEEEIFGLFDMEYIPPELRENNGEIKDALERALPVLVCDKDIKGVVHVHTRYSDGKNSIKEMARACMGLGYKYLGISDHSENAFYAGGLKRDQIKRQHEEIDQLNESSSDFMILKGIELDILPDGNVDYDEEVLSWFDFTIASVHSSFNMDMGKMTDRIIKALKNEFVTILGHPSGRLLMSRDPYRVDMDEIIAAASEERVILEINANPYRLDLDWRYCKKAKELGCKFAICSDAHSIDEIYNIPFGVNTARKGWLTKEDIINTGSYKSLKKEFI